MEAPFSLPNNGFTGYVDDVYTTDLGALAPPSKNVRISLTGEAQSRTGYEATLWSLGQAGHAAKSHYMTRYNVTFFSINGKVLYIEHDRGNAVVDTGLSLTATETTRFGEYAGDIYTINPTDGLRQIHVMRLNDAAPNSGDATVTVDQDGGGRLNAFSDTSGNLRIRGTDEAYTAASTAGVITLTGTLSQTYADNDIAITVEDISSGKPKGTKIAFWQERMIIIGVSNDTSVDNAAAVAYMSEFASARSLEKIIVFGNSGGASEEWVGKAGKLTNIVSTRDYLYLFKEDEVYFCSVASIDTTSGATFPQLLTNNYGCVNEDCAADMGDGYISFLTKNKRLMGIKISTQTGQALVVPDESFDQAVRNTCDLLDSDQSKARMVYHVGKRLLYVQALVQTVLVTFVFDNNIKNWLPPDDQKQFNDFFEKDGILYTTDLYDQTIYEIDRGTTDNGQTIETVMAHGRFPLMSIRSGKGVKIGGTCEWKDVEMRGAIAQNGVINVETKVDDGTSRMKSINASSLSFASTHAIGDVAIGDLVLGAGTTATNMADWQVDFRIAPVSYGAVYQSILSSTTPFLWRHYKINASALSSPAVTLS